MPDIGNDKHDFETRVCHHVRAMSGMTQHELLAIRSTLEEDDPNYQPEYRAALDRAIRNSDTHCI